MRPLKASPTPRALAAMLAALPSTPPRFWSPSAGGGAGEGGGGRHEALPSGASRAGACPPASTTALPEPLYASSRPASASSPPRLWRPAPPRPASCPPPWLGPGTGPDGQSRCPRIRPPPEPGAPPPPWPDSAQVAGREGVQVLALGWRRWVRHASALRREVTAATQLLHCLPHHLERRLLAQAQDGRLQAGARLALGRADRGQGRAAALLRHGGGQAAPGRAWLQGSASQPGAVQGLASCRVLKPAGCRGGRQGDRAGGESRHGEQGGVSVRPRKGWLVNRRLQALDLGLEGVSAAARPRPRQHLPRRRSTLQAPITSLLPPNQNYRSTKCTERQISERGASDGVGQAMPSATARCGGGSRWRPSLRRPLRLGHLV